MLSNPKNRKIAAILALAGAIVPVSGFHKFYLGQIRWGLVYVLLSWTPIPHIASGIEAVWYLIQDRDEFDRLFNFDVVPPPFPVKDDPIGQINQVNAIADAVRQLEQLRQDGLMSEYEFEQKRRQLLDL